MNDMIGLQIYTIRALLTDEAACTAALARVHEIGYGSVQLAGSLDMIERTAKVCAELDIPVVGILGGMELCEEEEDRLFAAARLCSAKDIGISSKIATEEQALDLIDRANHFAARAKAEGFTFSYHNHSNELIRTESGKTLFDLLIDGFDRETVDFMPDTYWLQHGGADVRAYLERLAGRVSILHLKDMKRTAEGPTYAEIGQGNMNFQGIIETARQIGVKHYIVEQDRCDGDPLESARISLEYLQGLNM